MRLSEVERRGGGGTPDPWAGARDDWERLVELAGGIGPADWAVDLVLVDDEAMAALNERWRDRRGVTDVLSFSYLESAGAGPPDLPAGDRDAARDLWLPADGGAECGSVVGELVVAPAFVARRCAERGWEPRREWPLLVVHGCLHVLGWEHDDEDARRAMADREAEHMARVGMPHPLRERS